MPSLLYIKLEIIQKHFLNEKKKYLKSLIDYRVYGGQTILQ